MTTTERSDLLGNAIDGNPRGTAWTTETYESPDFAGIKDGVGLVLEAEGEVAPTAITLTSAEPGWTTEIFGSGDSLHRRSDGWGTPLAGPITVETTSRRSSSGDRAQPLLPDLDLGLAPAPEGDNGFRVEISDVRLLV